MLTASPFVAGDVVVLRMGEGNVGLANSGNVVFLDEYTPTGTLVSSTEMPFNTSQAPLFVGGTPSPATSGNAPNPLVGSGSAAPTGYIGLSADGQSISFAGYDVNLPFNGSTNLKSSNAARVIGIVGVSKSLDDTTALTDFTTVLGNTPTEAITPDGVHIYAASSQEGDLRFATVNDTTPTTTSTQLNTATGDPLVSNNAVGTESIYNGVLYVENTKGIYQITKAAGDPGLTNYPNLPSLPGALAVPLSGISTPTQSTPSLGNFFFVTLNPTAHAGVNSVGLSQPDTLYVANSAPTDGTNGEIDKFTATSFDPTTGAPLTWAFSGYVQATATGIGGITGLTGYSTGSSVIMYAQAGNAGSKNQGGGGALFTFTDNSGYNATSGAITSYITGYNPNGGGTGVPTYASAAEIASVATNSDEGFRGIAFAPSVAPQLTSPTAVSFSNTIAENVASGSNSGELVSQLISAAGGITDTAGDHQGIAVTAADQTNGTWQFSLNGGTSWTNFPAVSTGNALTLASDAATTVRFVPAANYNGSATLTFSAWNQSRGVNGGTFAITSTGGGSPFSTNSTTATQTVYWVNQAPSFTRGIDQSVLNTASAQSITGWATSISPGGSNANSVVQEAGQTLNFIVNNNNNALFSSQPSIAANGTLTYTPAAGASGVATVTVQLHDSAGTANNGQNTSVAQTFQIAVTPVGSTLPPINSIPFATQTVFENGVVPTSLTFNTANGNLISFTDPNPGSGSATDSIALTVTGGSLVLSTLSGLTGTGNGTSSLSYSGSVAALNAALNGAVFTPTVDSITAATITLASTAVVSGSSKTSTDTININVTPVNQPPSFTQGQDVTVLENAAPYSAPWATGITAGPNQSSESVAFSVSVNNPALFSVQPTISSAGVLSFTPATDQFGTAVVNVTLQNSGSTVNGGVNTYVDTVPLLINITQVNQAPVNTLPGPQHLIQNTPLTISTTEYNAISVADPDGFGSTEQVTLTATNGTLTLPAGSYSTTGLGSTGLAVAKLTLGTGTNDTTETFTGTLGLLNAALDGLVFTPTTGFTGSASITIATDDLNTTVLPHNATTTSTLAINVVAAPPLVISQILNNPPGGSVLDETNDYFEIHGTPNYTIPAGTYFISVSGAYQSFVQGTQIENYPTGTVFDTVNLSGVVTGSDGNVVILPNGNTYTDGASFGVPNGYGVIDSRATVLDNTNLVGAGAGFGNNLASSGSSGVGFSSIFRSTGDTELFKPSATYLLINSPTPADNPNPGDELDEPLNVTPTGALHGAEYSSWNVYDSVGITQAQVVVPGDVSYGYINFVDTSKPNYSNHAGTQSSTTVPVPFTAGFVGRTNTDSGSIATDWVASSGLKGTAPFFGLDTSSNTEPSSYAGLALNNIGGPNFNEVPANVVTTSTGATSFALSATAPTSVVIDPHVTVTNPQQNTSVAPNANPNAYFLGSATVTITTNYDPATDSLTFVNTPTITGKFSTVTTGTAPNTVTTGVLTLTGYDSVSNWNAALQTVDFTYNGTVFSNASRTITFAANDGTVLSNVATKQITIAGTSVSPPVVTGTSSTPLSWTEQLPPASPQVVTVAPNLSITDSSTGQLASAEVQISNNFSSGEDLLGWNATVAAANGITVTPSTHFNHLDLAPTTGTTASLAAFQAVLQTVTYSDTSENPSTAARTVSFTVVDSNNISSSDTVNSEQVINITAVNNPPTTTTTSGSGSYTAGTPAILVDSGVTVTDPDTPLFGTTNYPGMTISITGGFHAGDTLGFLNQDGITGSFNASTGVLTLSGEELPLNYQLASQLVTFSTGAGAVAGTRTISFQADDGATDPTIDGNIATKQIVVTASATAPVVTTTSGTDNYELDSAATLVDSGVTITDTNTSPSLSATVSITGGLQTGDTLTFAAQNGITGVYSNGVLTLTGGGTGSSAVANYQTALQSITFSSTSSVVGTRTVSFTVTDGALTSGAATKQVSVLPFEVTSFTTNATGFTVGFNAAPNLSVLNLYSGGGGSLGTPDLTVLDGATPVQGSLVWNAANNTATFVQTRGALAAGTYNVTLVSGSSAWADTNGNLLGGGTNYTNSFTVTTPTTPVLVLPDFARGPGQSVNVNDATTGYANGNATLLPVAISSITGVTSLSFQLNYNSTYLTVTNVALASGISGTLTFNDSTPGVVTVSITNFSASGSGSVVGGTNILNITAAVPSAAVSAYGASALLSIVNPLVNGAASTPSNSFEKVVYFGDTNGDGKLTAADASLVARNSAHIDSGFTAYPLTDPRIVADITGSTNITAASASLIAQAAVHIAEVDIPTIPTHGTITHAGVDPTVGIQTNIPGTPGQTVSVPVSITDSVNGVGSFDFQFDYNPALLSITTSNISLSSYLTGVGGWSLFDSVDSVDGYVAVSAFATNALTATTGEPLVNLTFTVASNASTTTTPIVIDPNPSYGNTDVNDANGNPLNLTLNNGSIAITGSQSTPTVTVTDAGGVYNGSPYAATALVNNASSLEGVTPTLAYYLGSGTSGTPSATPPTTVGTYTVVANFAGSTDYAAASSSPLTFSITQATPTVTVSDAGGTYSGNTFPATAKVNGVASLESVTPTLAYYVGNTVSGTPSATAPTTAGTYTVVANFAGSTDYAAAASSPLTFSIAQATPTVTVSDAGGPFTGSAYPATAKVNGVASLEGVTPTLTYYVGNTVSGTPSATAPTTAGTYTVVANFAGSTDYAAAASSPLTFSIAQATPTVTVSDAGGPFTGSAYPATAKVNGVASLEGVTPTLAYYVGPIATGTPSATAPSSVGTYTVVANFGGSPDYAAASSSPLTFSIGLTTPTVTVSDAGGPFTGSAYPATAKVNNAASLEGIAPTLAYYVGNTVAGTPSATPPITAGTYTVVANFPGSTDYGAASSSPLTFSITQATSTVTVSDSGGVYNGSAYAATAKVNGAASLEGVTPTLAYYMGNTVTGTPSATAPSAAGTYTVVANFGGSTDFAAASSSPLTFSITQATPSVTVSDAGGTYNGSAYPATAKVNGGVMLEGIAPTLAYYVGNSATGTPSSTAPITAGTYTVVANFGGSADYTAASSSALTFSIAQATPSVTVSDLGGVITGNPFPATALVNGAASLEGVTPTLAYYNGTSATGTPSSTAPTALGTYTVVASFAGSTDYTAASSSALTFSITPASTGVVVSIPTSIAATAGQTVNVPVSIANDANGVASFDFQLDYNPALLSITTSNISLSSYLTGVGGWSLFDTVDSTDGYVAVSAFATSALTATTGEPLLNLTFNVASNAPTGTTPIVIDPNPTFGNTDVNDISGDPLPLTLNNGSVAITSIQTAPTVTVSDTGGVYNGSPYPANALVNGVATLEGVTPTLAYYLGSGTSGTPSATPPTTVGTYTVVANFAGSTDYLAASSSPVTFSITQATPTVTVSDAGGTYTGNTFPATAKVNGVASLESVTPTLAYYVGNTVAGTPSATAPTTAGTYTVVANFGGSTDYAAASSSPLTFTISQAAPTVTVSDAGGPFTGSAYPATAKVNGVASLEGVTPTLAYYVGNTVSGTPSATAPTTAGTYTVVANFAGSTDYAAAASSPLTFSIAQATPTVTVSDAGGPFTGSAYPATAKVNGVASLEGVTPTLAYYVGPIATGTPSATAPSSVGTYTVVANYGGSPDYAAASSSPLTFSIGLTTPTVTVSDAGGVYNGSAYPATAKVNNAASLEGIAPTLAYYVGNMVAGTPSATPPITAGTYTVVANFGGSTDYGAASSSPLTFSITQATSTVTVSDSGGVYNGSAYAATAKVNGAASLEGVTPTLAYYVGNTVAGTPSATAPIAAGTYTVVANFGGSTDYGAASSSPLTFSITQATSTVTVSDSGGVYNGSAYPATAKVNGTASLEGVTPTLVYYVGNSATGTPSSTAPITAGTYTVVANFGGSADYTAASSSALTFSITQATPSVTVSDAGGEITGNPFPATALVNGAASLEGVTPTLAYYNGTSATGTPSSTAPTALGTYTVVASFAGSTDYTAASSSAVTFSITPASSGVVVSIPTSIAATAGQTVNVPVSIANDANGVASFDFQLDYNPALLSITTSNISLSSYLTGVGGWSLFDTVDSTDGYVAVSAFATSALTATTGEPLLNLTFNVASNAPTGTTPIVIDPNPTFGNTDVNDISGDPLPLTLDNGSVAITGAPIVTVSDTGGVYNGSPYPANALVNGVATLEGVTPTLAYYLGSTVAGSPSATPPTTVGTYTVVANFAGSTDYLAASSSPVTFSITQATPTVTVSDAGGTYSGNSFPATAKVNGVASLESVTPTLAYYVGNTVVGTPSAIAPTTAGTYTVVANFAGSTDYAAASSSPLTFSIAQATPTVTVSDAGGTYSGNSFPATAKVNGVASLEGVTPTLAYYVGNTVSGTPSAIAPTTAGTYTVVANFAGSTDYAAASSSPLTFSIAQATPTVTVSNAGGVYNGSSYPATAKVNGVASLEGVTPTLAYYVGNTVSGTPSAIAPTTAGTYTVVANYAGSTDYAAGSSSPVTFTISKATPTVAVSDAGGTATGNPFPATAVVNGGSTLEGVTPTLAYYMGNTVAGTPSATAPSAVGTYTVVATFPGSTNYASASSSPVTFTISSGVTVPQVTGFTVEKGLSERSYIRYIDLAFNVSVSGLDLNAGTVTLTHYNLDGTLNSGNGVTNLGVESLAGVTFNQLTDKVMELDFGAGGIGGKENLSNTLNNFAGLISADGVYTLTINPDGTGQHNVTETFYRLFGDVVGNASGGATVTGGAGGVGAVTNADVTAITAALGKTSSGVPVNADVNGAGAVSGNDRTLTAEAIGRKIISGININD